MKKEDMLVGNKVALFKTIKQDLPAIKETLKEVTGEEVEEDILCALLSNKICFTAIRKFGKEIKKLGFVILETGANTHSINIQTLFTPYLLKGLSKKVKNGDLTYTEDILKVITDFCINKLGVHRIETTLSIKDKNEALIYKKSGYIKEGIKRDYFKKGDSYSNGLLLSYIKE